jgi:WD40 repeat protein
MIAHDNWVNSVCISANFKNFISGSNDKSIKIWNIEGNLIKSIDNAHDDYITTVCITPDK